MLARPSRDGEPYGTPAMLQRITPSVGGFMGFEPRVGGAAFAKSYARCGRWKSRRWSHWAWVYLYVASVMITERLRSVDSIRFCR